MDDYRKKSILRMRLEHHGISDLLGDKMDEETAKLRCKTCKRDGMPSDGTEECARCERTRKLYEIRKEMAEWHDERYGGERLDRFDFDDEVFDKWPYLKEAHCDGMWYLDHTIKRDLDSILGNKLRYYQELKGVPYYRRSATRAWKKGTSMRKGERVDRKSPLVSACCFDIGTPMKGNDGWMYIVKLRKDNTHFWSKKK